MYDTRTMMMTTKKERHQIICWKVPPVLGTQYLSQGSTGGHSLLPLLCFFTCALCYIGNVWQYSTIYGNNVQQ